MQGKALLLTMFDFNLQLAAPQRNRYHADGFRAPASR
jgi:hypothetical protein